MEKIKKWMKMLRKDQRGLTLVELLAVIVILGIVGLIAFVAIGNVVDNSKTDAHIANAQQVISAAELYEASGGVINESIETSDLDTIEELVDPWNPKPDAKANPPYGFTINKVDSEIVVTTNATAATKCKFTTMSKTELTKNRDEICGKTGSNTIE